MSEPEHPDQVGPALRRAEAELARHLQEACEDHDPRRLDEQSTDELLRLEEELLAAARAADQAVRLRRKLGDGQDRAAVSQPTAERGGDSVLMPRIRVREFRTTSGSEWRVWEVRPGIAGRPRKAALYPPDYAEGWLAFELLQGEGRKRLPKFAPEWCDCADTDLETLLAQAVDVPQRRKQGPPDSAGGPANDS